MSMRIPIILLIVALFPLTLHAQCRVWHIERRGGEIRLASTSLDNGRTEVLQPDGTTLVNVIVIQAEGQSSDIVTSASASTTRIIARCQGDTLRLLVQRGNQPQREIMAKSMRALQALRVTVHVTGGDGVKARFRIDQWTTATREDGPVIDLFQGRVPIGAGGHAITTVVEAVAPAGSGAASLSGTAAVRYVAGYPFLTLEGARPLRAVLDFAAASTVVRRSVLPEGVIATGATMRQSSAQGTQLLSLSVEGAGGSVAGIRTAMLPLLQFGTVRVEQLGILALDSLPTIDGAPIDAIVGLDVLQRAGRARLSHNTEGEWTLTLGRDVVARGAAPDVTLPLRRVGALVGIDVLVDSTKVFLVLDSGSPYSVVSQASARAARLTTSPATGRAPRGLDGHPLVMRDARVQQLGIGAVVLSDVALRVADLPVLAKLGAASVGLLGGDVLQQFSAIELDFAGETLRLWR